jgi:hypothetical protein
MNRPTRIFALAATTAALALATAGHGQAAPVTPPSALLKMAGMWDVHPHRPGPGRGGAPGAGGRRGFGSPPDFGARGNSSGLGHFSPPPGGPDRPADDLPGPNIQGLDRGDKMTFAIMTPKGRAAFEAMDPHDLPANNCKSNGLPSLVGIPDAQQWTFKGNVLTIKYADSDTVRTIYLDGRADSGPPSLYGHSVGTFANGELTVTTTDLIATPGGLGRNAPGSASRSYVEHYRLSPDGTRIIGYLTVHDPDYLTRDLRLPINFMRSPKGTVIPDVGCNVADSQSYLDN